MFSIAKFGPKITATIPRNAPPTDRDTLLLAVQTMGYILPHQGKMTGPEFAAAIRRHCSAPQADAVARIVEKH